jgi:signal transduction histidine kinase
VYPAYPGQQGRPSRPQRPPLTQRLRTGHWIAIDCVVAAFVTLFVVAVARQPQVVQAGPAFGPAHAVVSQRSAFPVVLLLAPGTFVPIGLRRRAPVLAFGVLITLAAIVITADQNVRAVLLFLGAAYVLYTVTVESSRRTGVAALALGLGVMTLALVLNQQAQSALNGGIFVPVAFGMVIAWIIGYSVRQRRLYILTLQHQAASSAVAEERLRIARELHDVVAHSMSVIAVQAGYGQYVIDASPEGAREALDAIQATSRDALDEMRRMLGVLRQQDSAGVAGAAGLGAVLASGNAAADCAATSVASAFGTDSRRVGIAAFGRRGDTAAAGRRGDTAAAGRRGDAAAVGRQGDAAGPAAGADARSQGAPGANAPAPLAPAPGLADLGRLIERTSGAGITVSLEISGSARPVPASVDLSAYRIIQEALTNVVKHAGGGASCAVVVRYTDAELVIRVTDDGGEDLVLSPAGLAPKAAPVAGGGHGIIGMRERTALCSGQFRVGPRHEGGWQVNAVLPLTTPGTDGA